MRRDDVYEWIDQFRGFPEQTESRGLGAGVFNLFRRNREHPWAGCGRGQQSECICNRFNASVRFSFNRCAMPDLHSSPKRLAAEARFDGLDGSVLGDDWRLGSRWRAWNCPRWEWRRLHHGYYLLE